ncbi:MAG TPA: hypothetical protein VGJ29_06585 [Vicinamibacterales bacterium]
MATKKRVVRKVRPVPTAKRVDVTRDEFDRVIALLSQRGDIINGIRHDLDIQFKRMAQIQGEVDEIQRAIQRLTDQLKG